MRQFRRLHNIIYVDKFGKSTISELPKYNHLLADPSPFLKLEEQYPFLKYFKLVKDHNFNFQKRVVVLEKLDSTLAKYNSSASIKIIEQGDKKVHPKNIARYLRPLSEYEIWVPTITNIWSDIMKTTRVIPKICDLDWLYDGNLDQVHHLHDVLQNAKNEHSKPQSKGKSIWQQM